MKKIALRTLWLSLLVAVACAAPQKAKEPAGPVYTFLDIPMAELRTHVDQYRGTIFEDRVKYYHTYHSREDADPTRRMQVIEGKTHFTARPVGQYTNIIQVQITPEQDKEIVAHRIYRQDVLRVRLRLAGIAPGGALAFDLIKVLEW
jgi:hypothetical protein